MDAAAYNRELVWGDEMPSAELAGEGSRGDDSSFTIFDGVCESWCTKSIYVYVHADASTCLVSRNTFASFSFFLSFFL